jgi:hypothetical protein
MEKKTVDFTCSTIEEVPSSYGRRLICLERLGQPGWLNMTGTEFDLLSGFFQIGKNYRITIEELPAGE